MGPYSQKYLIFYEGVRLNVLVVAVQGDRIHKLHWVYNVKVD
jgi:hypothetical protein